MTPTAEEIAYAAKLLRAAGWTCAPPSCPECAGSGSVTVTVSILGSYDVWQKPCSRGCKPPMTYNGRENGAVVEARATGTRLHPL